MVQGLGQEMKLASFTDDVIVYVDYWKWSMYKLLKLVSDF